MSVATLHGFPPVEAGFQSRAVYRRHRRDTGRLAGNARLPVIPGAANGLLSSSFRGRRSSITAEPGIGFDSAHEDAHEDMYKCTSWMARANRCHGAHKSATDSGFIADETGDAPE
ncbi:MAG: hypothetical protein J0H27_12465 [Xanthomonadales bacterium]|nr:hypothetical protein [Xanthomonadales bacterium]